MGYARQTALPKQEPVSLALCKQRLRIPLTWTADDQILGIYIQAAREEAEKYSGRSCAQRTFVMVLDAHPYAADTMYSSQAYPPSYYSLPRYATTLWNYSQMIKLPFAPVISVESMVSINADGSTRTMSQDVDFILDRISEPARIFPLPGTYWPADLYVANALQINFTAGYDADPTAVDAHDAAVATGQQQHSTIVTGISATLMAGMLSLISYWYENPGMQGSVPRNIEQAFESELVIDFSPTRG